MSDAPLGDFSEGFASWRSVLGTVAETDRLKIFQNIVDDVISWIGKGLDRIAAADELTDMALSYMLDPDQVQTIITRGWDKLEELERVPEDWGEPGAKLNGDEPHKGNGGAGAAPRFTLKRFDQIRLATTATYLIKGLLPRSGLAVFWGPPKCGKSFVAFDAAMHIAIGREYRGRRVQQGTVVYCALEGGGGFAARVEAWRKRKLGDHQGGNIPFFLLDVALDLIADQGELVACIRAQVAQPTVVFIDTLNRGR
jgi:hypothetical protein